MTKPQRIKWRAAYDGSEQAVGDACATSCPEDSLTQQSFADDADLNIIVQRFGIEKVQLPPMADSPDYYGDFSNVPDLRSALDAVNEAKNRFMDLPAKIRERFDHNPAKLWHFVNDPENGPEAVKLGLLKAPPDPTPAPEPPAPEKDTP